MLQALVPLAIVDLPIVPGINTFPVRLPVVEEAKVGVVVRISFETSAVPHVDFPLALVLPSVPISHHTFSLAIPILHLAHVQSVCVSFLKIVRELLQRFKGKLWAF